MKLSSPLSADNEKKVIVVLRTPEITTVREKMHIYIFQRRTKTIKLSKNSKFSDYYQVLIS